MRTRQGFKLLEHRFNRLYRSQSDSFCDEDKRRFFTDCLPLRTQQVFKLLKRRSRIGLSCIEANLIPFANARIFMKDNRHLKNKIVCLETPVCRGKWVELDQSREKPKAKGKSGQLAPKNNLSQRFVSRNSFVVIVLRRCTSLGFSDGLFESRRGWR